MAGHHAQQPAGASGKRKKREEKREGAWQGVITKMENMKENLKMKRDLAKTGARESDLSLSERDTETVKMKRDKILRLYPTSL